jgi:hypothetical protein
VFFNPLSLELNPICYLLALLAHDFFHVSRIKVKSLTLRLLMSYIYIYIYDISHLRVNDVTCFAFSFTPVSKHMTYSTFIWPCIVIYLYSRTNEMQQFLKCTFLYMFRTVFPSIIRSLRLYIQHQVYVKQILLTACLNLSHLSVNAYIFTMSVCKSKMLFVSLFYMKHTEQNALNN